MLFTIHAYNIDGFVKLNHKFARRLNKIIDGKFNSINNFSKVCRVNRKAIEGLCQRNKGHMGFIKTTRLFVISDFLRLDKRLVEKQISLYKDSKLGAYNRIYRIKFPYAFAPLVIRPIAHMIGDGSIYKDHLRYSQQNVKYIKKLSENITNPVARLKLTRSFNKDGSFKEETFHVPMFLAKCACHILNINRNQFSPSSFLKRCLNLPKEYRVQVLAAIFVDEGCIKTNLIGMKNKEIMMDVCKLIDSLCYKRGALKHEKLLQTYKGKIYILDFYTVRLSIVGLCSFIKDINESVGKYGIMAGLFNKQKDSEKRISLHEQYVTKHNEIEALTKRVITFLKNRDMVDYSEIITEFGLNMNIRYILNKLVRNGTAFRESRGVYSYAKNERT